jgi:hypothetical protein
MPTKSPKQYGLMQGVMHGSITGKGLPSPAVAKEFIDKTPKQKRSKFASALKKHGKRKEVKK